jgi:TP901 family phage tail tape measure protein
MAADFESAMARVRGLTTLTEQNFQQASVEIMALAREYPTAPNELADALYFAGSAGLAFREAMDVVEMSAGAAAIGMGEANDIAKILIFSLNNFRSEGLTAAKAMDVFTAAIKEGTADPDELALALGRVLSVAKEAGVTFEQTVGSIASLTNIGLPTRVASTSLRALFGGLLAPTIQATEALDALGTSNEELRKVMSEGGPIAAIDFIEKLRQSAGGMSEEVRRRIVPQIRAFTAVLGLAGDEARRSASIEIFKEVTDSAGDFQKALSIIQDTASYKFGQSLNNLRIAAIELGSVLFPVFEQITKGISAVGLTFANSSAGVKTFAAAALIVAAIIGPLVKGFALLTNQGMGLFTSFRSTAAGLTAMGIAAAIAVTSLSNMAQGTGSVNTTLMALIGTFAALRLALGGISAAANAGALGVNAFSLGLATMSPALMMGIAGGIALIAVGVAALIGKAQSAGQAVEGLRRALVQAGESAQLTKDFFADLDVSEGVSAAFMKAVQAADRVGVSLAQGLQPARQEMAGLAIEAIKSTSAFKNAPESLRPFIEALSSAEGKAVDLNVAFREAGVTNNELYGALLQGAGGIDKYSESTTSLINDLFKASSAARQAKNDLNLLAQGAVLSKIADDAAALDIGKRFKVPAGEVKRAFAEYNIGAGSASEETINLVATQNKWVDSAGQVIGMAYQQKQAFKELAAEIQASFSEGLVSGFFEKDLGNVDASISTMLSNADQQISAFSSSLSGIELLRGKLDPATLSFLVEQGPGMIRKFVNASDAELSRLQFLYHQQLAAVDAEIVKEGDHEEVKGQQNVKKFSRGILSAKGIPKQAALQVIAGVTVALSQGKDPSKMGADKLRKFAQGIASQSGATDAQAKRIVSMIINTFGSAAGPAQAKGNLTGGKFASGIRSQLSATSSAAFALANAVEGPISSAADGAYAAGAGIGDGLVAGMASRLDSVRDAGAALGEAAKTSAQSAARNSPKYFSYYMGQDFVKQLQEGFDHQQRFMSLNVNRGIGMPSSQFQAGSPQSMELAVAKGVKRAFDEGGRPAEVPIKIAGHLITMDHAEREIFKSTKRRRIRHPGRRDGRR